MGLLRSERPLGIGAEGDWKLRLGAAGAMRGAGAERGAGALKVGRDKVRGAEKVGVGGGELKTLPPRNVEGRVTCDA